METKTRLPATTGVDALGPVSAKDQLTPSSGENFAGNPFSAEDPSKRGPRHCIQSSPKRFTETATVKAKEQTRGDTFMKPLLASPTPNKLAQTDPLQTLARELHP